MAQIETGESSFRDAPPLARTSTTCCPSSRSRRTPWRRAPGSRKRSSCSSGSTTGAARCRRSSRWATWNWGADIHIGSDAARHIEEIRRIVAQMKTFTTESERAAFDAQMLYGVNVFARAKVIPDMAISRGKLAYEQARSIGDSALAFLSAGGTALALADVGECDEAMAWLDRASATAIESPTPPGPAGSSPGVGRSTFAPGTPRSCGTERAAELAAERDHPAARCEAQAQLALAAARSAPSGRQVCSRSPSGRRAAADLCSGLPGQSAVGRAGRGGARAGRPLPGRARTGAHARGRRSPGSRRRGRRTCTSRCSRRSQGVARDRRARVGADGRMDPALARDGRAADDRRGRSGEVVPRSGRERAVRARRTAVRRGRRRRTATDRAPSSTRPTPSCCGA